MSELVIQKAGSASDVITKNNNRVIYGNILGQELAAEAGIIARVTRQAGGGGAASSRNVSAIGGTIFTYAERAAVVSNIIANTATNPTNALVLATAASDIGITLRSPYLFDYSPVIEYLFETNTLNTGRTAGTLTTTVNGTFTFGTNVGYLSASFPNSASIYLTIPFRAAAGNLFSISYWYYTIDTLAIYAPWGVETGTSGGIVTQISAANIEFYYMSGGQTIDTVIGLNPTSGAWNYITITVNITTGQCRSYLNSRLRRTSNFTTPGPLPSETLTIGRNRNGTVAYKGYMRRFRVYDYILSGDQIASIYYQDSIA